MRRNKLLQKAIKYSKKSQDLIKQYEHPKRNTEYLVILAYDNRASQNYTNQLFTVEQVDRNSGIYEVSSADLDNDLQAYRYARSYWFPNYREASKAASSLKKNPFNHPQILSHQQYLKVVNKLGFLDSKGDI